MSTTVACVLACVIAVGLFAVPAFAVNIETVPVGNAGNAGELSGSGAGGSGLPSGFGPDRICGAVAYNYRIGKYEVTAGQYTMFLNAVAQTDTYGLYSTHMAQTTFDYSGCNIKRSGTVGHYSYSVDADYANRPVNWVSWGDAARFSNWMHNGQPSGDQNATTTEDGAYTLNGKMTYEALMTVTRNADARWAIPTEDEWHKAAYHKNDGMTGNYWDYPTSNDAAPGHNLADVAGNNANYYGTPYPIDSDQYWTTVVGEFQDSESPYGTYDQGGNVWEWNETIVYQSSYSWRSLRGGSFRYNVLYQQASNRYLYFPPALEDMDVGFRVVEVPEPASLAILAFGGVGMLVRRRGLGR